MVGQLLNRGGEEKLETDKSGFPVGDPRAKGGTELDIGLQVGPAMWRWPTVWPYPQDFFDAADNVTSSLEYFASNTAYGPFVTGEKLAALHAHLNRHLPPESAEIRMLDLGAGAHTLLPADYTPGNGLVGLGASEAELAANSRLTERVVLDLNDLDEEGKSSTMLPFADKSFDVVLCTTTMEYLMDPRSTFREVYRVLKEGGSAIVAFTSAGSYAGCEEKRVKYWADEDYDFNDAKKV
jgi:SAM-dependent methyltransferase